MCGVVGVVNLRGTHRSVDPRALERMRDVLAHRGPDGAGLWIAEDGKVGLGHRRLSIIDLSSAAAQPMSNEDGTLWISFNGEIYNHAEIRAELEAIGGHKWKTDHSDTEVILHAFEQWGIDCLHRFRGMWAFALWDGKARSMWLARDRLGIKPLYYSIRNGRVAFASEIKAILDDAEEPYSLNEEALFEYLSFLTVPAPNTLFSGIKKLASGTWLRIDDDGHTRECRYWDPLDRQIQLEGVSTEELADLLLHELREAVRLRTVSDVPVGAFLSGGIDSSVNVALLSEGSRAGVQTFTVGFRGQTTYRNENEYAKRVADMFRAHYHEKLLGVEDLIDFLPKMVYLQDEPIADPVCVPIYYLARLARENGVIVCQVGEGADELFAGYPSWRLLRVLQAAGNVPVPHAVKRSLLWGLEHVGKASGREYEYLRRNEAGVPVFWSGAEAFTHREKLQLLSPRMREKFHGMTGWESLRPLYNRYLEKVGDRASSLTWMTYSDLNLRLPELLLMRVDKMSMAEGIEGRVPFLDHRFVELAMSIPASRKTPYLAPKHMLKRAVRGLIPDDVIDRKKQGFGVPVQEWLLDRLGKHAREAIEEMVAETDWFDPGEVRRVLATGKGSRVWFLLNLALWWKRFLA